MAYPRCVSFVEMYLICFILLPWYTVKWVQMNDRTVPMLWTTTHGLVSFKQVVLLLWNCVFQWIYYNRFFTTLRKKGKQTPYVHVLTYQPNCKTPNLSSCWCVCVYVCACACVCVCFHKVLPFTRLYCIIRSWLD